MDKNQGPLAPGLLIASPPLGDPNFDRTVVLLALHGEGGALGFVINRVAPIEATDLLRQAGYEVEGISCELPVYLGGPVKPRSGWIIGRDLGEHDGLIRVDDRVGVTSSPGAFDALAADLRAAGPAADPKGRMILLGYSGWGPGQLEAEIASGAWLPVPLDNAVLFDVDASKRWEKAYQRMGLTAASMMTMRTVGEA